MACLSLAACALGPTHPLGQDASVRHPILVRDAVETLRLEMAPRETADMRMQIAQFASAWRQERPSQIHVQMPQFKNRSQDRLARAQLNRIRAQLLAEGVRAQMMLRRTPLEIDETPAILLSFTRVKAGLVTTCGLWPDDMASASSFSGWDNAPYAEFGCSYQTMLAVQTADPRDLTSMRAISPADGQMRARAIANARQGQAASSEVAR